MAVGSRHRQQSARAHIVGGVGAGAVAEIRGAVAVRGGVRGAAEAALVLLEHKVRVRGARGVAGDRRVVGERDLVGPRLVLVQVAPAVEVAAEVRRLHLGEAAAAGAR